MLEPLTPEQAAHLSPLIATFKRAVERQQQRDADVLAGLVRVLSAPRGTARHDAERLRSIIKQIAQEERTT
jgi:hypothetical protein